VSSYSPSGASKQAEGGQVVKVMQVCEEDGAGFEETRLGPRHVGGTTKYFDMTLVL